MDGSLEGSDSDSTDLSILEESNESQSLNDLVVLCKIRAKLNCWKGKLLIPNAFGYEV